MAGDNVVEVSSTSNSSYDQVTSDQKTGNVVDTSTQEANNKTSLSTRSGLTNQAGSKTSQSNESGTRQESGVTTNQSENEGIGVKKGSSLSTQNGLNEGESSRKSESVRELTSKSEGFNTSIEKANLGFRLQFTIALDGGTGTETGGC